MPVLPRRMEFAVICLYISCYVYGAIGDTLPLLGHKTPMAKPKPKHGFMNPNRGGLSKTADSPNGTNGAIFITYYYNMILGSHINQ